jgi:hypothetical protein
MLTNNPFLPLILRAPDGGAGGGTPPTDPAPVAPGAAAPAPDWWASLDADTGAFVTAKGLTGKPLDEAFKAMSGMYRNAETALGKKGIPAPEKGQDTAVWLAANREALGLPADVAGYAVEPPEGFAPDLWDADLATKAAEIAHANGVPPSAHKAFVDAFVQRQQALDKMADDMRTRANAEMRTQLERDFGKDLDVRITGARQAAQRIGELAGLDTDGLQNLGQSLADATSPATVIRIFDQIARMMADDSLVMAGAGSGGTPTEAAAAQAELATLLSPDGEHGKAVAEANSTGNRARLQAIQPKVDRLRQIIAAAAKK